MLKYATSLRHLWVNLGVERQACLSSLASRFNTDNLRINDRKIYESKLPELCRKRRRLAKLLLTGVEMWNESVGEILKNLVGANVVQRLRFMDELATQRTTILCSQVLHQTAPTNCKTYSHTHPTLHTCIGLHIAYRPQCKK